MPDGAFRLTVGRLYICCWLLITDGLGLPVVVAGSRPSLLSVVPCRTGRSCWFCFTRTWRALLLVSRRAWNLTFWHSGENVWFTLVLALLYSE